MYPDNFLTLREDFFYSELCGRLQVLPLDDRNWLLSAHTYTPTHTSIYTYWLKPDSCLADVEIVALFL